MRLRLRLALAVLALAGSALCQVPQTGAGLGVLGPAAVSSITLVQIPSSPFTLTSVANFSGTTTVYTGTITGGAANAYANFTTLIAGFTTASNNGTFLITASNATTITVKSIGGSAETHAATATIYNSASCFGTNPYNCTIKSSGAGHLFTVVQHDTGTTNAATAPTDTNGDIFTVQHVSGSHFSVSYVCSTTSGNTTVTIKPNAGASSAVVSEWQGAKTSSCNDGTIAADTGNATSTTFVSVPLESTVYDLALGMTGDAANANNKYVCGGDWSTLNFSPETTDGDALHTCYTTGVKSQFTLDGTITASTNSLSFLALFKAATDTATTGSYPTSYIDFSACGNGVVPTGVNLVASTFGGLNATGAIWTVGTFNGGTTCSSTNTQTLLSNVNVMGIVHGTSTATNNLTWNPSVTAANQTIAMFWSGLGSSASACGYFWYSVTPGTGVDTNFLELTGGDRATPLLGHSGANDVIYLETAEVGASATITVTPNTRYEVYVQLINGGTSTLAARSCGTSSSPTSCGSFTTISGVTSSTAGTVSSVSMGHVSGGNANTSISMSDWQIDPLNSASAAALCP